MRTRSKSKRPNSPDEPEATKGNRTDDNETLPNISRAAVGKLLKRAEKGFFKEDVGYLRHCEPVSPMERSSEEFEKRLIGTTGGDDTPQPESHECVSDHQTDDEDYGSEWEDGSLHSFPEDLVNGVSVEFDVLPGSAKRKLIRRATAEEKELAELVHKAHLLCLLGRGRLIDSACNDPLIQASLLSLVPKHLLKIADAPYLTAKCLSPLVDWVHNNFRVRSATLDEKSCDLAMTSTLESQEGTPEVVTALSVALFMALNLTTRFVSILDVVSLKHGADKSEHQLEFGSKRERNVFNSATPMVAGPSNSSASTVKSSPDVGPSCSQTAGSGSGRRKANKSRKDGIQPQDASSTDKPKENMSELSVSETTTDTSEQCPVKYAKLKRKGDLEFEMQLKMALAATAIGSSTSDAEASNVVEPSSTSMILTPPSKRMKKIIKAEPGTSSSGISTAIGSKKVGAPLYWAEVFCSGENLTGKWVHVDAINAVIDGEDKVEAAAAACRKSLRYVVAFAGNGAKDVTRRYCTKWYKVASRRISSTWWDAVLAPLKELESAATAGISNLESEASGLEKVEYSQVANADHGSLPHAIGIVGASRELCDIKVSKSPRKNKCPSNRSSLEDMELETRALTEPLPTNQQAYRTHPLYVIERWLKKHEILHPKRPVLGFISGHAVYPRTCVQTLHTKERWLREALQVKTGEVPAKVLNRCLKSIKEEALDDNHYAAVDHLETTTALYGKWQTEPLCVPRAVNGIVPKNERGRVDVWSEKCLPPGTVHLRLPRVAQVAKRLDINYASAMVGFEFRNGRCVPSFEGIVVCEEFKDAVLAAYVEEEERREADEKKRKEAQALSRWYQLLSSIITRQRLNTLYGNGGASSQSIDEIPKPSDKCPKTATATATQKRKASPIQQVNLTPTEDHEHEFVVEEQATSDGLMQIKRCHCGFLLQFEEL
ncbi:DNA repair protein RAD4-like isoform X1 [Salvia splendens]|uniref:DNA repair protein RAD4-like isoform X1 n=1 Tax=Salvia splendens TaxID=180675 RepID=UPI001C2779C9|nr:DNA repair protein RAD4-like isoform X1 [Salvia splendens]